jgi:hypothetical protein
MTDADHIHARIDALIASARRQAQIEALIGVADVMCEASRSGKDTLGVVEAVALHVQARLQVFGAEMESGR